MLQRFLQRAAFSVFLQNMPQKPPQITPKTAKLAVARVEKLYSTGRYFCAPIFRLKTKVGNSID